MHIVLETDECRSLMTIVTSYAIDKSGVSQDGKSKIRRWRTDHADGTVEMDELAVAMNESLGTHLDDKLTRFVRKRGGVQTRKERAR